ncbi:hypothetical protein IANJMKHF_00394 [Klebsiella phage CPRSA]|nr:hypothetical protein IANJMKHF_00394 [Klebsiella phage CPRSA]
MKLPKNTTLLTREKLHSVDWCPLDIMIFDIESRVINAKYQGVVFSLLNSRRFADMMRSTKKN